MRNVPFVQQSFAQGELSPRLQSQRWRQLYQHGAAVLENWWPTPEGWLHRRPSFRHDRDIFDTRWSHEGAGPARLFQLSADVWALAYVDTGRGAVSIRLIDGDSNQIENDDGSGAVFDLSMGPARAERLCTLNIVPFRDDWAVVVQANEPERLLLKDPYGNWRFQSVSYDASSGAVQSIYQPFTKIAGLEVTLSADATNGAGESVTFTANAPVFGMGDVGTFLRFRGVQALITSVTSEKVVRAQIRADLTETAATAEWQQEAFSFNTGYPRAAAWWKGRLWLAGSFAAPMFLAGSSVDAPLNFDDAEASASSALMFTLRDGMMPGEKIQHLLPDGSRLLIFTSHGVWEVTDNGSSEGLQLATISARRLIRANVSPVQPIVHQNTPIFVTDGGKGLNELRYSNDDGSFFLRPLAQAITHRLEGIERLVTLPDVFGYNQTLLGCLDASGAIVVSTLVDETPGWCVWTSGHPTKAGAVIEIASSASEVLAIGEAFGFLVFGKLDPRAETDFGILTVTGLSGGYSGALTNRGSYAWDAEVRLSTTSLLGYGVTTSTPEVGLAVRPRVTLLPPDQGQQGLDWTTDETELHAFFLIVDGRGVCAEMRLNGAEIEVVEDVRLQTRLGVPTEPEETGPFDGALVVTEGIKGLVGLSLPPASRGVSPMEAIEFRGESGLVVRFAKRLYAEPIATF